MNTWESWAVVGALAVALAFFLLPAMERTHGCGNDRFASGSLKTIGTAQADFRSNDRDGNGVHDFWTDDVYNLYAIRNQGQGDPIKLVEISVAMADVEPHITSWSDDRVGVFGDKGNYVFGAWQGPHTDGGAFRNETGGPLGRRYHLNRFAFFAAPRELQERSERAFVIDEGNTMFQVLLPRSYETRRTLNPRAILIYNGGPFNPYGSCPDFHDRCWSKMD